MVHSNVGIIETVGGNTNSSERYIRLKYENENAVKAVEVTNDAIERNTSVKHEIKVHTEYVQFCSSTKMHRLTLKTLSERTRNTAQLLH